jgi:hypothetical protein
VSRGALTPLFFVTAHSKEVMAGKFVTAHSTGLKVGVLSTSWPWRVSAHSKEVTARFIILISILIGTAHSKGVRGTTWRADIEERALSYAKAAAGREEACRPNELIISDLYNLSTAIVSTLFAKV